MLNRRLRLRARTGCVPETVGLRRLLEPNNLRPLGLKYFHSWIFFVTVARLSRAYRTKAGRSSALRAHITISTNKGIVIS